MGGRRPLFPPVFEPVVSRPMLDDFSVRAARLQSRTAPQGFPIRQMVPLRSHPMWSGNNELGREVEFAPDATLRQMVLKLGEWSYPEVWTLSLGMTFSDLNTGVFPPSNYAFAITAEIDFGIGGAVQQVEVDWVNGTTIRMPMNALVVTARATNSFTLPPDLRLRATVGIGGVDCVPPNRTLIFDTINAGASGSVVIPKYARRVALFKGQSGAGPNTMYDALVRVGQSIQAGAAENISLYGPELLAFPDGMPIVPFSRTLNIFNGTGNPLSNIRAVFELAL